MSFSPVVSSSRLSENKVVWSEEVTKRSSPHGVHGTRFEVYQNGSGDISSSGCFVIVDIDSFKLEVGLSLIGSGWVDSVFVGNDFPELSSDLVTALPGLYVDDFSHL